MPRHMQPLRLTDTTRKVLDFIIRYKMESGGDSPSIRELMDGTGIPSSSYVKGQLDKLERMELIKRKSMKSRSIMVVGGEWRMNA